MQWRVGRDRTMVPRRRTGWIRPSAVSWAIARRIVSRRPGGRSSARSLLGSLTLVDSRRGQSPCTACPRCLATWACQATSRSTGVDTSGCIDKAASLADATVRMTVNGFGVGNPLTDNGWSETGYRWHDTLHLAHAVCLGWSPVFRGLAGLKRRSDPRVDHIEDGGRAAVADEAIAWAVFCRARGRAWYEGREPDGDLLRSVQEMTYGLEVSARSTQDWAHAIGTGLACLRAVWSHGGGVLLGDLTMRTLRFAGPLTDTGVGRSGLEAGPISAGNGSRSG